MTNEIYYRISWWLRRSLSPEYQRAYSTITAYLQTLHLKENTHLCEAACGNGEMLSRISKQIPQISVCGFDACEHMLHIASERLAREGIKIKKSSSSKETPTLHTTEVQLFTRNLFGTEFPNETFDVLLFTFPDIMGERVTALPFTKSNDEITQEITQELNRILKPGGLLIRVEYNAESNLSDEVDPCIFPEVYEIIHNTFHREQLLKLELVDPKKDQYGYSIIVGRKPQ